MMSAGGVSFTRNPLAPARSALITCSSASKVVSTMTCGGGSSRRSAAVAVMPSICGRGGSLNQHDVRAVLPDCRDRPGTVVRLGDEVQVLGRGEDHPEPGAHQRVVVDQED